MFLQSEQDIEILNNLWGNYFNFGTIKRERMSLTKQGSTNSPAALNKYSFTSRKTNMTAKAFWLDTELHLAVHQTAVVTVPQIKMGDPGPWDE